MGTTDLCRRRVLHCVVGLLVIGVAGCGGMVKSSVTRYHQLKPQADGKFGTYSFFIPPDRRNSLEYTAQVELVKNQLNRVGFTEAHPPQPADFTAFLGYSIQESSGGVTRMTDDRMEGNSAFAKGWNAGGVTTTAVTSSNYSRKLFFRLATSSAAEPELKTVYEAQVLSVGSSGQIGEVMPALVKAMFEKFPGNSGETISVTTSAR